MPRVRKQYAAAGTEESEARHAGQAATGEAEAEDEAALSLDRRA